MFTIKFLDYAEKKARKLVKNNSILQEKIGICLIKLKNNPFGISLKTHKVRSKLFGIKYSSSVQVISVLFGISMKQLRKFKF